MTKLVEHANGWNVALDGAYIDSVSFDYAATIVIVSGKSFVKVRYESEVRLCENSRETRILPEDTPTGAPLLSLVRKGVDSIFVCSSGILRISLTSDAMLVSEPNYSYEAWNLSSDAGYLLICNPGGGVTVFAELNQ